MQILLLSLQSVISHTDRNIQIDNLNWVRITWCYKNVLLAKPYAYNVSYMQVDLSKYDNVVVFGVEQMMPDLEAKLLKELSRNGCVVACRFPLPSWTPTETVDEGIDMVWLYTRDV